MDFVIGGLAAAGASVFSNPFDVIKTRMQLQGELKAKGQHTVFYKNTMHAAYIVAKNEGLRGLQKGLGTALMMHCVRNSVRLGSYQTLHEKGLLTDQNGRTIFYRSLMASAVTGAAGAFFGSPLFLIKTQLQSQAAQNIAVGFQHHHSGTLGALSNIYTKFGVKGLWRGSSGTMIRAVAGSSAQLTTFAKVKDLLKDWDVCSNSSFGRSLIASFVSGIVQAVAIAPFDIVSTRLYNQGVSPDGRGLYYNGIVDCFIKIWKAEGFLGFYKGLVPNYMRLAPHGAICLVLWDLLKDLQVKYVINVKSGS